jgi:hypothetical protein
MLWLTDPSPSPFFKEPLGPRNRNNFLIKSLGYTTKQEGEQVEHTSKN